MESMEETLEIFSFEGRPLRASVAIALTQQKITESSFTEGVTAPPAVIVAGGPAPARLHDGSSCRLQCAEHGGQPTRRQRWRSGRQWRLAGIASANGIENPRFLGSGPS